MELDKNTQEKIKLINERNAFKNQVKELQEKLEKQEKEVQKKLEKKDKIIQKFLNVLEIYGDSNNWDDFYDEYGKAVGKKKIFNYNNDFGYLQAQEVVFNYLVKQEV